MMDFSQGQRCRATPRKSNLLMTKTHFYLFFTLATRNNELPLPALYLPFQKSLFLHNVMLLLMIKSLVVL
jgi:hypothetical protein